MNMLPAPERSPITIEARSPIETAIDVAFRAYSLRDRGAITPEPKAHVEYAVSPVTLSDEDISTIVMGTGLIYAGLKKGNSSRVDMLNDMMLELSAQPLLDFDKLSAEMQGQGYVKETLFGVAQLVVDNPYPPLYKNFSAS